MCLFSLCGILELRQSRVTCYNLEKMRKHAASRTTTQTVDDSKDSISDLRIVQSFADTTWRIAVPVVGMTMMGIYVDTHYGTKPWLTLTGTVIGFVLAGLLVKRQLKAVSGEGDNKNE